MRDEERIRCVGHLFPVPRARPRARREAAGEEGVARPLTRHLRIPRVERNRKRERERERYNTAAKGYDFRNGPPFEWRVPLALFLPPAPSPSATQPSAFSA
jgi:hypothetical protein